MHVEEMLLPAEKPRVDYRRVFAWRPVMTADEGRVWLRHVWRISVLDAAPAYSVAILPL